MMKYVQFSDLSNFLNLVNFTPLTRNITTKSYFGNVSKPRCSLLELFKNIFIYN